MNIDHTFVINLKHRKDRKKNMIKQLKKVHLQTYEFFDAIRPSTLDLEAWNPYFLNPIPDWFKITGGNELKYKIGCLGCLLSHMEVIKLSIERNYERVLILEDDTEFQLETSLSSYLKDVSPRAFGLFYLAGNHRGSKIEKVDDVLKVEGTYTTGSYIIDKSVMSYIVQHIQGFTREIDVFYANVIQKKFPCYCVYPHITKQAEGYSDIVQKEVCYNLNISM
jgi:hypothetical protein